MNRLLALTACAAAMALGPLAAPSSASAQVFQDPRAGQTIMVPKDKSAAFRLDYPASEIVVAQPDTLSLVATTDRSFYVRGKQLGVTNILIYDAQHRLAQVVDVRVGYDVASLQSDLETALPGEHIEAANFADGVLLSGEVSTPAVAARAEAIAERYAPKNVDSELTVAQAQQVQVDVRVIEVSHSAVRDLGFNFNVEGLNSGIQFSSGSNLPAGAPQTTFGVNGKFGAWQVDANIQALEQKGAIRELARPNLIAMSGEEASFLAGGQFPIPVPGGALGAVSVQFEEFGVKLKVTPVVESNGEILLKIAPEVSELDPKDGISAQGFQIPAITTRRASTQVELRDGESFAIAGLFQRGYSSTVNQIPGASNLPVLGALFRSSDWQRNETELVIIVTPHLTSPVKDIRQLPNPLQETSEATAIDVMLDGKTLGSQPPANPDGDLIPANQMPATPAAPVAAAAPPHPTTLAASKP